jgi:hypothetical protein
MEEPSTLPEEKMTPVKHLKDAVHIFSNDLRPISQGFIVSLGVLIGNRTITILNIVVARIFFCKLLEDRVASFGNHV